MCVGVTERSKIYSSAAAAKALEEIDVGNKTT